MDRQDINDELSSAEAQELLGSTSAAHLAYIGEDGTPRVIPVGFFWTGDQFVIATATTSPKVTALSARPDVALTIDAGGHSRSGASPVDTRAAPASRSSTASCRRSRRRPEEHGRRSRGRLRAAGPRDVRPAGTNRNHPHWVRYYDFGAGRMPQFLKDLAERDRS